MEHVVGEPRAATEHNGNVVPFSPEHQAGLKEKARREQLAGITVGQWEDHQALLGRIAKLCEGFAQRQVKLQKQVVELTADCAAAGIGAKTPSLVGLDGQALGK